MSTNPHDGDGVGGFTAVLAWIAARMVVIIVKACSGSLFKPPLGTFGILIGLGGIICIGIAAVVIPGISYYDYVRYGAWKERVVIAALIAIWPYMLGEMLLLPVENFSHLAKRVDALTIHVRRIALGHLVLTSWLLYFLSAAMTPSRPAPLLLSIVGVLSGIFAVRRRRRWMLWSASAAGACLVLVLFNLARPILEFMSVYPSFSAALKQLAIDSELAASRMGGGMRFAHLYQVLLMPIVQVAILAAFAVEAYKRSNFSSSGRATSARRST